MGPLLALTSAICYGIVDFAGGILSRRAPFAAVTFLGRLGGPALACAAALLVPADPVRLSDLLWGALSGLGSGTAMRHLNRGLSRGAMSVVVPLSAVTGVALSVLCGVLALGDRPGPLAWTGIAVTVPALWLVAGAAARGHGAAGPPARGGGAAGLQPPARADAAVGDGLPAGAGVAVQYVALGLAGPSAGLWPVAAGRVAAVVLLLPHVVRHGPPRLPRRLTVQALLVGAGAALGLILYLLAAQRQLLAVAVVLASLYPAIPVILGLALLHERVTSRQTAGLLGAAAATVLLTLG
ncbi:EamA family transporter [Streptomyces spinosisporus]|uniref:EamA family transporter n=1 Tax=Streptomyces spinosisporus TaxID=2927582 RepID=A0ABS9XVP5_9ACTN|nr:EamA family transporter [Streptomyces spinosisporus]MCI3246144.1 EamA family transporter [Streptomyces spinosisporus]